MPASPMIDRVPGVASAPVPVNFQDPLATVLGFFVFYVAVTGLSLPGATIMTLIQIGCSQRGLPNWVQQIVTGGIITNHGGGVAISSQLGKGTSARVYLPAEKSRVAAGGVSNAELRGTATVLVVDDELSLRRLLEAGRPELVDEEVVSEMLFEVQFGVSVDLMTHVQQLIGEAIDLGANVGLQRFDIHVSSPSGSRRSCRAARRAPGG